MLMKIFENFYESEYSWNQIRENNKFLNKLAISNYFTFYLYFTIFIFESVSLPVQRI